MPLKKLTCVVASYNYADFLTENLTSLCSQWKAEQPFDILIIDDGSSDNSLEIAREFSRSYEFITVVTHRKHKNLGLPKSIEKALEYVETEWICFLESDDIAKPDSINKILSYIDEAKTKFFFFGIEPLLEEQSSRLWFDSYVPRIRSLMIKNGADKNPFNYERAILWENIIPTFSCVVIKKNVISQCNFNTPVTEWLDWYLWIQLSTKTKVMYLDEQLIYWRIHGNSQNRKKNFIDYLRKYRKFRKSVAQLLWQTDTKKNYAKILILCLPAFVPLICRMLNMYKYIGLKGLIKSVNERL